MEGKYGILKGFLEYNNATLDELVLKRPSCVEELLGVAGFGRVKASKYGGEILEIIKKY